MGTTIAALFLEREAERGGNVVRALFNRWEELLSRFLPDSELSYLNRSAGIPVRVGPLLFHVLETALAAARATNGLYDPTLLSQLIAMGYDRTLEDVPAIQSAAAGSAVPGGMWRLIRVNRETREVTLPPGVGLDFGGIAKGMAVDAALDHLREIEITTALVNAGGDLAAMGTPPSGDHWPVAIEGKDTTWVLPFQHGALATSGISRRRWRKGTQTRHHLIDPRTGASAQSGLWSVTVAAGRCEQAEVGAKAAFLAGTDAGRKFIERHGLAGLLVREDGSWTTAGAWPAWLMKELT
jgi:thiamine biosynthesis lipoprotein